MKTDNINGIAMNNNDILCYCDIGIFPGLGYFSLPTLNLLLLLQKFNLLPTSSSPPALTLAFFRIAMRILTYE